MGVTVLGQVEAIFRYPVKSMRGEALEHATVGWYGVDGDRRLALRRRGVAGGFPWLSASALPELVHYTPLGCELPTHVRTPEGDELEVFGDALAAHIGERLGTPVEMMQLRHGMFDETPISIITSDTIREIGRLAEHDADIRRFRPNIVVRSANPVPFEEDGWVGGTVAIRDAADAPTFAVTMRDLRCTMVNIDPDGGPATPAMMKAIVRRNDNYAGVYAQVTRTGRIAVGQTLVLVRE